MKELIIKEETLDIIRQMVADGQVSQEVAEKYFPKLKNNKNNKNEKIRKSLIILLQHFCKGYRVSGLDFPVSYKDMLNWVEIQDEQSLPSTNERVWLYLISDVLTWKDGIGQYLDDPRVQNLAKKLCEEYSKKLYNFPISSNSSNIINNKKESNDKIEPRFKVKYAGSEYNVFEVKDIGNITYYGIEDEPNHIDYVKADSCEIINDDNDIKENRFSIPTKPILFSDKVESKFKIEEGKWYVCTQTFVLRGKIVVIKGSTYQAREDNAIQGEDECLFIDKHDGKASEYFRSWTIQDIKEGDMVVDRSDGSIGIFQSIGHHPDGGSCNDPSYCFLYCRYDDGFFYADFENGNTINSSDIIPATKEQRDQLEKAMTDAGYTFDFCKKELKKIEKKSDEWSEEDETKIKNIITFLQSPALCCIESNKGIIEESIKYLKNIKYRCSWKPSEEQMRILNLAIKCGIQLGTQEEIILVSLFNDLKKLITK